VNFFDLDLAESDLFTLFVSLKTTQTMSTLGKSIVRGFGFAVGSQIAKNVMNTPIDTSKRIFGISTKRQWYSIGLWLSSFLVIPFLGGAEYGVLMGILNLILGFPIQILIQYFLQKKDDEKQYKKVLSDSLVKYNQALSFAKQENVDVSELILSDLTSIYNLNKFEDKIKSKVNRTKTFRGRYSGQELNDVVNRKVWLGMTIENLVDMFGKPSQIEVSENSRSKYETLIYGVNKRSGDVYTFRNGLLKEFKDR
jgi:hypothetical protein